MARIYCMFFLSKQLTITIKSCWNSNLLWVLSFRDLGRDMLLVCSTLPRHGEINPKHGFDHAAELRTVSDPQACEAHLGPWAGTQLGSSCESNSSLNAHGDFQWPLCLKPWRAIFSEGSQGFPSLWREIWFISLFFKIPSQCSRTFDCQ